VLAHDHVLDLHRLDQQCPQLLAVVDYKLCFRHDGLPTGSAWTASPEVFWHAAGHDHPPERGSFAASSPSGTGSNRAGGAGRCEELADPRYLAAHPRVVLLIR